MEYPIKLSNANFEFSTSDIESDLLVFDHIVFDPASSLHAVDFEISSNCFTAFIISPWKYTLNDNEVVIKKYFALSHSCNQITIRAINNYGILFNADMHFYFSKTGHNEENAINEEVK